MMKSTKVVLFALLMLSFTLSSMGEKYSINWEIIDTEGFERQLYFSEAILEPSSGLPLFTHKYEGKIVDQAYLQNITYTPLSSEELKLVRFSDLEEEFKVKVQIVKREAKMISYVEVIPLRYNPSTKKVEKLLEFDLNIIEAVDHSILHSNNSNRVQGATNSVLSTGNWFKLGIVNSGIYLLNYNYLTSLDASFGGANLNSIKLYGNGGDMLPCLNGDPRIDDLAENPMQEFDQNGNGKMDPGDYLLFYGDATEKWELSDGQFKRDINIYSDTSYYFLTSQGNDAIRINSRVSENGQADAVFNDFDERIQHQEDLVNLEKSGREWYGELFDFTLSRNFSFSIPNMIKTEEMCISMNAVARHTPFATQSIFRMNMNGNLIGGDIAINGVNNGYGQQYNSRSVYECITPQNLSMGDDFTLNITYDKNGNTNAKGYLNYITVQAKRALTWDGSQLDFRHKISNKGELYQYNLANAPSDLIIWDVTDPINPVKQNYTNNGTTATFKYNGQSGVMNEFIAFTPGNATNPISVFRIANQNLHAHNPKELIIISHPSLLSEAKRFKDYKETVMGLDAHLVTTQQIYNEFSSGKQDLTALRDYLKLLYDRGPDQMANVLLFGDASYDYKYRSSENTNLVPVFQSSMSLHDVNSHSSDDYIAFLDDGIGCWAYNISAQRTHKMNLGVGRFPVKTPEEAAVLIDKVIFYENRTDLYADWLNKITFVADDDDGNLHMEDSEDVFRSAVAANPAMDIQKIYVDAYPEVASPSGALSIEGKNALDRAIQDGTLIVNYSGHGGEIGWTEEQILRLEQISQWRNYDKLTFFFTATCEFGRYDDPDVVAGGELVLLERTGGAVGIMTTTRPVYTYPNRALNIAFYDNVFDKENGEQLSLGEVIRRSKNQSENTNNRNFALLGDPSMKLNYPEKRVIINEINNIEPTAKEDTLKALCLVNIKGEVTDLDSTRISEFNGLVDLKVYDKQLNLKTLGNSDPPFSYSVYKNLLFKGKASVTDGRFSVEFVVPKDIDYTLGKGKIIAYAYDKENGIDANGFEDRFFVGGSCDNIIPDDEAPQISLYLDDTSFVSGDLTSSSPLLLAFFEDDNGINFTGTGIGHDITALVSASPGEKIILNDYYLSELDNYQKGSVAYRLKDIPDGEHILTVKAWDTHNNSAEESVSFLVSSDEKMALMNVMNYPNPFTDETYFSFDHNRAGDDLIVEIRILDRMGRLVKSGLIEVPGSNTVVDGSFYEQFRWDGTNSQNQKLNTGLYYYEIKVKSKDRHGEARDIKRLVYIK